MTRHNFSRNTPTSSLLGELNSEASRTRLSLGSECSATFRSGILTITPSTSQDFLTNWCLPSVIIYGLWIDNLWFSCRGLGSLDGKVDLLLNVRRLVLSNAFDSLSRVVHGVREVLDISFLWFNECFWITCRLSFVILWSVYFLTGCLRRFGLAVPCGFAPGEIKGGEAALTQSRTTRLSMMA
jgi:hypothetical protein